MKHNLFIHLATHDVNCCSIAFQLRVVLEFSVTVYGFNVPIKAYIISFHCDLNETELPHTETF